MSTYLREAVKHLFELSQRDMWIADKLEQMRATAEKQGKVFDEARVKMLLVRKYMEELRAAPRAVALDVRAAQERQKSTAKAGPTAQEPV
jgi:hypothetical protein